MCGGGEEEKDWEVRQNMQGARGPPGPTPRSIHFPILLGEAWWQASKEKRGSRALAHGPWAPGPGPGPRAPVHGPGPSTQT